MSLGITKYFGTWSKMLCWFHRDSSVFWARLATIQLTYFVVNKVVQTRHKKWTRNDDLEWTVQIRVMHVITLRYCIPYILSGSPPRAKLYICHACVCNRTLRLGLRAPLGRPQLTMHGNDQVLWPFPKKTCCFVVTHRLTGCCWKVILSIGTHFSGHCHCAVADVVGKLT